MTKSFVEFEMDQAWLWSVYYLGCQICSFIPLYYMHYVLEDESLIYHILFISGVKAISNFSVSVLHPEPNGHGFVCTVFRDWGQVIFEGG